MPRIGQIHASGAVGAIERFDRAVADDRSDRCIDAGQDALRLAVFHALQVDLAQADAQHALGGAMRQIVRMTGARMVAVGMGDDGAIDRAPGVDVEIANGTVSHR